MWQHAEVRAPGGGKTMVKNTHEMYRKEHSTSKIKNVFYSITFIMYEFSHVNRIELNL